VRDKNPAVRKLNKFFETSLQAGIRLTTIYVSDYAISGVSLMPEAILYVHVPFCSSKCHFCNWVSPISTSDLVKSKSRFGEYATAVIQEIRSVGRRVKNAGVQPKLTYFGGGTPSLLDPHDLGGILNELFTQFPKGAGFLDSTIEMSPDTANLEKLKILREYGFSRISFGVQSFNEKRARSIGRAHSPLTAIQAFETARQAGFDNINVDLMIGFPEETEEEYLDSVQTALMLEPDHLSVYIYKKFPGTVMARLVDTNKLKICPHPVAVDRYRRVSEMLNRAGYSEYMFQLFHKAEKRCFVDYHYFHLDYDYIGFGQGAHTLANGRVYAHKQSLEDYMAKPGPDRVQAASESESLLEAKFFEMLHTREGIDFEKFASRLKISFDDAVRRSPRLRRAVNSLLEADFVERTRSGVRFSDQEASVRWLSLPPYFDPRYQSAADKPDMPLVSILAAQ